MNPSLTRHGYLLQRKLSKCCQIKPDTSENVHYYHHPVHNEFQNDSSESINIPLSESANVTLIEPSYFKIYHLLN